MSAPIPWRKLQFKRKRSGLAIAEAQVQIAGRWHEIQIIMDIEGFRALSNMPERSRYLLLDSLATMPIRAGDFDDRRGGLRDRMAIIALENARWIGPSLLSFLKALNSRAPLYRKILSAMKSEEYIHFTPYMMAAYLIERRWCRAYKTWPSSLKNPPSEDPKAFFKMLRKNNRYNNPILPKLIPDLIDDILANRETAIIIPGSVTKPRFMTDFNIS